MDFKDFYKLLDEVMEKEPSGVTPSDENYNNFLMNRYLSFICPEMSVIISKTSNIINWLPESHDEVVSYKGIKSIIPKIGKRYIEYIRKPVVVAANTLEIPEEDITLEAKLNECSKREIRNLILDYAKRS